MQIFKIWCYETDSSSTRFSLPHTNKHAVKRPTLRTAPSLQNRSAILEKKNTRCVFTFINLGQTYNKLKREIHNLYTPLKKKKKKVKCERRTHEAKSGKQIAICNALEKDLFTVLAVDVMLIIQAQQTNSLTDETNCNRSKEIL